MGDINGLELFYWVAFLFGIGYAVLGLVTGGLGGHEAAVDHEVAVDHEITPAHELSAEHDLAADHGGAAPAPHVSPFNSLTIAAFSLALGALGLVSHKYVGLDGWQSFLVAGGGALVLAAGFFAAVVRPLYRSESTSSPTIEDVVRSPAVVHTAIPPSGMGEIVYVAGGSRFSVPARSAKQTGLAAGTRVAILRIRQGVAEVVRLEEEE